VTAGVIAAEREPAVAAAEIQFLTMRGSGAIADPGENPVFSRDFGAVTCL
jgi:hypothetical protein